MFKSFWDIIDQPELRPMIEIEISADYTEFKKTWRYGK